VSEHANGTEEILLEVVFMTAGGFGRVAPPLRVVAEDGAAVELCADESVLV
jgi:hypothetical protein